MRKTLLSAVAIAGVAGAFAVPTMVSGNARRTEGSLSALQAAETPFLAELERCQRGTGPGDPDGAGTAAVSFDPIDVDDHRGLLRSRLQRDRHSDAGPHPHGSRWVYPARP